MFNMNYIPPNVFDTIVKNFNIINVIENAQKSKEEKLRIPNNYSNIMHLYYNKIPDIIKQLDGDDRVIANNILSIAYLYGIILIPFPGIASSHLEGSFTLSSRKEGTGYLSLDSIINDKTKISKEKLENILAWLKSNNSLYMQFTPKMEDNLNFRIDPTNAPYNDTISIVNLPQPIKSKKKVVDFNCNVLIHLKNEDNNEFKYYPLEHALALSFPLLFPFGIIDPIPGTTLRKKALNLILSHTYFRCGRLACHMILFLYHIVMEHDALFYQNFVSLQKINAPIGSNRNLPPSKIRSDDPEFPEYWSKRQAEVRSMCSQFGDPDLMLTFTFVNKWKEVEIFENEINLLKFDKIDIRFCPLEDMIIWCNRLFDVKKMVFRT